MTLGAAGRFVDGLSQLRGLRRAVGTFRRQSNGPSLSAACALGSNLFAVRLAPLKHEVTVVIQDAHGDRLGRKRKTRGGDDYVGHPRRANLDFIQERQSGGRRAKELNSKQLRLAGDEALHSSTGSSSGGGRGLHLSGSRSGEKTAFIAIRVERSRPMRRPV